MAQNSPIPSDIERLIRSSDAARGVLGAEIRNLKYKLDVPARLKESLKSHPTGWLGGSLVAGMFGSLLFRRKAKREKAKKKGVMALLLSLGLAAARPAIKVWLAGQLKNFIGSRLGHEPFDDIPSRTPRRATPFYK